METDRKYSIGELSDLAGVTRRTIRYYVQRGLVPPPLGAGRGHYYTGEHLQLLLSIKLLQDRSLSLEEIERNLAGTKSAAAGVSEYAPNDALRMSTGGPGHGNTPEESPPDLSLWTRVGVAEGIELHIEGGRYRLSPGRMLRLRQAVRAIIGDPFPPEDDETQGEDDHG